MVILVPITVIKNKSFQCNTLYQNSQCHEDTTMNRIMSYLPKMPPCLAREEVAVRMKSYKLCWKISINDWREYNWCAITPWHEGWYNEAELRRRLHCTEEEAKILINSNPGIFTGCYFFYSILCNNHALYTNQVYGALVQKKDEALWIQTDTAAMSRQVQIKEVLGHVRHSFSSKHQM